MNRLWVSLIVGTLALGTLAGCAGKNNGTSTSVHDLDDHAFYDSALADTGYRVTGNITAAGTALPTGANGSAASVNVVDLAADDAGGALDKADFLLDAKDANGTHVQAELRSMTTAKDAGLPGDFFGGVAQNQDINGATGVGYSDLPTTKAYLLASGLARVKIDDVSLDQLQLVQVAVTRGIHDDKTGALLSAAQDNDLELQVLFPGSLTGAQHALPNITDGFLYYYFENVKLTQLGPDAKAEVGAKLKPAEKPNVPPVANGTVMFNGAGVTSVSWDPDTKFLNVTFDATNSTDPDGTIEAYSWDVKETNANGTLVPLNRTSGKVANFTFTTPGVKQIELRVIDNNGGIANITLPFVVNYKKTFSFAFGAGSTPLDSAGAGTSCQQALNCNQHQISVYFGAKQLIVAAPKTSGVCQSPTVGVRAPGSTSYIASGGSVTLSADKLSKIGKYGLDVWFEAQAQCKYTVDVTTAYDAPAAAAK